MIRKYAYIKLYLTMPEFRELCNAWLRNRWAHYVRVPFWRMVLRVFGIDPKDYE